MIGIAMDRTQPVFIGEERERWTIFALRRRDTD